MSKRILIKNGGLTSSNSIPNIFTAIGSTNDGMLKKQISSNINDISVEPTTINAIHIPFSEDKPNPIMGFARGVKLRTSIFNFNQSNVGVWDRDLGQNYPPMPLFTTDTVSIGLVHGESSIKSLNQKPIVIKGFEEKLNINYGGRDQILNPGYDPAYKIEFIKSLIENSEEKDIQMEYLYHEGQSVINTLPIVHFDGKYITVDARETDIIEDTYLWYVIRNVVGTTIDISIQIFVCNCELDWPNTKPESVVTRLFNSNSPGRLDFIQKNNNLLQKIDEYFTLLTEEPIDCETLLTVGFNIENKKFQLYESYDLWMNSDLILISQPDEYNLTFVEFEERMNGFSQSQIDLFNSAATSLNTFECAIQNSTGWQTSCGNIQTISTWGVTDLSLLTNDINISLYNQLPDVLLTSSISMNNDVKGDINKFKEFYLTKKSEYTTIMLICATKLLTAQKLKACLKDFKMEGGGGYFNPYGAGINGIKNFYCS